MTSMEMRQLEAGSSELVVLQPPPLRSTTGAASSASHSAAHSTDDLSNCGSKLNLLPEQEPKNQETRSGGGRQQRLHYSNPSCDLLPASANTHQQATSIETTFNTVAQPSSSLSPGKLVKILLYPRKVTLVTMETSVVLHSRHFPLKDKEIFYSRYLEEGKHL